MFQTAIQQIENALRVLQEMLTDRGYDTEEVAKSLRIRSPKDILQSTSALEVHMDDMTIFFCIQKDSVKEAREIIQNHLKECEGDDPLPSDQAKQHFLIILQDKISSNMTAILEDYDKRMMAFRGTVSWFTLRELQFNISKHAMVPTHTKLTEEEIKSVMQTYRLKKKSGFPAISRSDPMARYLGLRTGDVVRIHRINQTSGEYFYYRCCT